MTPQEGWKLLGELEGAWDFWIFLLHGASGTAGNDGWLPVLNGQSFIDSDAAELFGATEEQIHTWRARLVERGLLRAEATERGARHWVSSRIWAW
jgi:hypothetical protein